MRALKRIFDVAVSGILLVLLSPILGAVALGIKLTSPGPILYPWRVVGKDGRFFDSHKFRSMVPNADALKEQLMASNEMRGPVFKMQRDPRITPIGRLLRKYSLDELPQLWSVFKGDMSLVGPRPPLQSEYVRFTDAQKGKLAVKPGITCLWQVSGRNQISDFDDWVRLDLEYIRTWSFWLDVKILLLTLPAVVRGSGAA
jgi:lipopolysaccharide/colanic/teichoic acid biosynthesis glycosyltransferase